MSNRYSLEACTRGQNFLGGGGKSPAEGVGLPPLEWAFNRYSRQPFVFFYYVPKMADVSKKKKKASGELARTMHARPQLSLRPGGVKLVEWVGLR